jgi:hypothetical protein
VPPLRPSIIKDSSTITEDVEKHVQSKYQSCTNRASTFPKMTAIPVRVTSRKERDLRKYYTFNWHQTNPTKRYFVGEFNKSVSIGVKIPD